MALTDKLTAIADAIRAKAGTTDGLTLDGMVAAIEGISGSSGGIEVVNGTLTIAEDISSRLPLFETDKEPDLLYLIYMPTENSTSTGTNRVWAGMERMEADGSHSNALFARINGTTFVPSVTHNGTYNGSIKDGYVTFPWQTSTARFTAGQIFYYTAIYFNKEAE